MEKSKTDSLNEGFFSKLIKFIFKISAVFFLLFLFFAVLIYLWFSQYLPIYEFDHNLGEVRLFNSHLIIPETPESFLGSISSKELFKFENDVLTVEHINLVSDQSRFYIRGESDKFKYQCSTDNDEKDRINVKEKKNLIVEIPPYSSCMVFLPRGVKFNMAGSQLNIVLESLSNNISMDLSKGFLNWRNQHFDRYNIVLNKDERTKITVGKQSLQKSTFLFEGNLKLTSSIVSIKNE